MITLFLKIVLFTLVAPGTVTVLLPALLLRGDPGGRVEGIPAALGGLLILTGVLLYVWCAYEFARFGQGTPAPIDPPRHLVDRGLYARTRNPMYLHGALRGARSPPGLRRGFRRILPPRSPMDSAARPLIGLPPTVARA